MKYVDKAQQSTNIPLIQIATIVTAKFLPKD